MTPESPPEPIIDTHIDQFLSDMSASWRQERRNKDRSSAARILQITLKAIPKGTGRLSDWLGPKYFDEVKPIKSGCRVRVLKCSDPAEFRNKFENSCLGELTCIYI